MQILLCDHHYWGGMRQVQRMAKLSGTFNIGLSMHSNSHLGIYVAAATPHFTYSCDTHYPWQSAEDELVAVGGVSKKEGCVWFPESPGLGVEWDHDQLERGKEPFATIRYRKRDGAQI